MSEEPKNLPAIAHAAGTQVVQVLSWKQHAGLNPVQQQQISMIVLRHSNLATEYAVDILADAAGYYGMELNRWFEQQVETHGIEVVALCIEALDLLGQQGHGTGSEEERISETFSLDDMLNLYVELQRLGRTPETAEYFAQTIGALGGWTLVCSMGSNHLEAVLNGEVKVADVHDILFPPPSRDDDDMTPAERETLRSFVGDDEDDEDEESDDE